MAAKQTAAFSGEPMRSNLVKQLNDWGVHTWLGLSDSSHLFGRDADKVQSTSLLRYPVFHKGEDYQGKTPNMLRNTLLRAQLYDHFVEEVNNYPDAVFLGLGPAVQKVLDALVAAGDVPAEQVYGGMLHPSGNNTYRLPYLISNGKGEKPYKTNPAPYWEGRERFRTTFLTK